MEDTATSNETEQQQGPRQPRDAGHWASSSQHLKVSGVAPGAKNINVEGRNAVGPLQGFGPMWQKTYKVSLAGSEVTPQDVIKIWKENFASFWPEGNHFYAPLAGVNPGEVALIDSRPNGLPLSTGVLVMYADDESFTLMTTQGHPFSGWVTFSAYTQGECTIAQAQVLMRANDPIYEVGMRLGGHKQEDEIWKSTLLGLASKLNVEGKIEIDVVCVDPKMQWRRVGNVWHNAGMRSTMHVMTMPLRKVKSVMGGNKTRSSA